MGGGVKSSSTTGSLSSSAANLEQLIANNKAADRRRQLEIERIGLQNQNAKLEAEYQQHKSSLGSYVDGYSDEHHTIRMAEIRNQIIANQVRIREIDAELNNSNRLHNTQHGDYVAELSFEQKLALAVEWALQDPSLSDEARSELENLASPEAISALVRNMAMIGAGGLAAWYTGVGGPLLAGGLAVSGLADIAAELYGPLESVNSSQTEPELRSASSELARAIGRFATGKALDLLLFGAGKGAGKAVGAIAAPKGPNLNIDAPTPKPGSAHGEANKTINAGEQPAGGNNGPNVDPNNVQANNGGNANNGFNNANLNKKPDDPNIVPFGKKKSNNHAEEIASEAAQGFKNLECTNCRESIERALKRYGIEYEIVEIKAKGGRPYNIYSDKFGDNISTNGYHTGIKIGDIVFDNHNPNGINFNSWLSDLHAPFGIDSKISNPE